MDINHIGLSHIAGIISFLITGDTNGYELSCLRKECGKIFTASALCHFTQLFSPVTCLHKIFQCAWKGSLAFNIICWKFHHRK